MTSAHLASVIANTEAGSYLTFAIPVGIFCVIAVILYLLLSRPHARARWATGSRVAAQEPAGAAAAGDALPRRVPGASVAGDSVAGERPPGDNPAGDSPAMGGPAEDSPAEDSPARDSSSGDAGDSA